MKTLILILIGAWFNSLTMAAISPIQKKTEEKLRGALTADLPGVTHIVIENFHTNDPVPDSAILFSIHPQPPVGVISFEFMWTENGISKQTFGNAIVKGYAKVAVAKTPIRHGEPFSEENVRFEEQDIAKYKSTGYYGDYEKLSAVKANGYIAPGTVIGFFQTQTPQTITAGQMVELIYQNGNLKVSAKVKAMESGRVNQWIRLENPVTRKVIQGRVLSGGEVSLR